MLDVIDEPTGAIQRIESELADLGFDDYSVQKVLRASGEQGTAVILLESPGRSPMVMKRGYGSRGAQLIRKEAAVMEMCDFDVDLSLRTAKKLRFIDGENPFLLIEYIGDKSLADFAGRCSSLAELSGCAIGMMTIVHFFHKNGMICFDLGLDDFLISPGVREAGKIRKVDFAGVKMRDVAALDPSPYLFKLPHVAPEYLAQLKNEGKFTGNGELVDIYACASMLFQLIYGENHLIGDGDFRGITVDTWLKLHRNLPVRKMPGLSKSLQGFILQGLSVDPTQRFGSMPEMIFAFSEAMQG